MQLSLSTQNPSNFKTECLIVPVAGNGKLSSTVKALDKASAGVITTMQACGELTQFKHHLLLPKVEGLNAERLLLVSTGNNVKLSHSQLKQWLTTAFQRVKTSGITQASIVLDKLCVEGRDQAWTLQQAAIILAQLRYSFTAYKTKATPIKLDAIQILVNKPQLSVLKKALATAEAINHGVHFTKDLANTPCNVATPSYLAKQAEQLAKDYKSLTTKIHDEKALKQLKMGALLAVGQGSEQDSRLIEVHYQGAAKSKAPIVFVGKGVTFDTGGISLKSAPGMEDMKYDMGGAATLFGLIKAVAELKLPLNVSIIIPSAENMPDGKSYKPGDIITSMSGQTIEILNTDAEGRLLLCDGLTYAKRYNPALLVDVATLTGAMVVALGNTYAGFYTDDEKLVKQMQKAVEQSEDLAWRMPLHKDYVKQMDSKVADMKNTGGRWAGSCTAAGFLSRFVDKDQAWMHMDIAGVANIMGHSLSATGRPVPLLVQLLQQLSKK